MHGGAFLLTVLARITLCKTKSNKPSVLLSCFSGTYTLEHCRADQIKCIVSQLQPTRRSPRVSASTSWLTTPGWLDLANDVLYLIGSAVFQCTEHH
jgi:hypothetical protein